MDRIKKMLLVFAIIVVVAAVAVGISYYSMGTFFFSEVSSKDLAGKEIGPNQSLGEFLVNASGTAGYQFIKASVVVEVDKKDVLSELKKREPQLRDIVISILRNDQLVDINEAEGTKIKNEIKTMLNEVLISGKITRVWFTQFVVQ